MLKGKKIILGITGSIAAYKSAVLTRLLVKAGAEVKIVMTPAAKDFVTPLSLSTLSGHSVLTGLAENDSWANHVMLGRWADIMLIAPLSCNTLAKMSAGICDNLLMAVYLSATCPVIVAPAMDEDMWRHRATTNNLKKLTQGGNFVLPVEYGELASGLTGDGRMAEPETIVQWLEVHFSEKLELSGKKALVTAGPTQEAIDPVRFIGNHSSGKMGLAIAREMQNRGAQVTLVMGPTGLSVPQGIKVVNVLSAAEMFRACESVFPGCDIAILNAAVADYTIREAAAEKIKKTGGELTLNLTPTRDILKSLGELKKKNQFLVGFALETTQEKENALKKLESKNADMIILNSMRDEGAGFNHDTNKITIFDKNGGQFEFELKPKKEVAVDIVNAVIKMLYAKI